MILENEAATLKLGQQIASIKKVWPFLKESDSSSGFYEYRISDCRIKNKGRIVLEDAIRPPLDLILKSNKPILFLTHPCYWE